MTTATILFNDYFGADRFEPAALPNNAQADVAVASIIPTLTDGRLHTSVTFSQYEDQNQSVQFDQTGDADLTFDSIGLVRVSGLTDHDFTASIGDYQQFSPFSIYPVDGNARLHNGNSLTYFGGADGWGGFVDYVQEDSGAHMTPLLNIPYDQQPTYSIRIAGYFVGNAYRVQSYYPRGWRPPLLRNHRDRVVLSENGYPLQRRHVSHPQSFTLPLRFLEQDEAFGRIQTLLTRMQTENFLWRWGDEDDAYENVAYCWADGEIPSPRYIAPGLLETTVRVRGYHRYD